MIEQQIFETISMNKYIANEVVDNKIIALGPARDVAVLLAGFLFGDRSTTTSINHRVIGSLWNLI